MEVSNPPGRATCQARSEGPCPGRAEPLYLAPWGWVRMGRPRQWWPWENLSLRCQDSVEEGLGGGRPRGAVALGGRPLRKQLPSLCCGVLEIFNPCWQDGLKTQD